MKKGRMVLAAVLSALAVALLGTGVYLYPAWRCGGRLQEKMDFARFSYEMEVELNREALKEEQKKLFEVLGFLTGRGEEALYRLTIRGSVWEDRIHVRIYPMGAGEPLVELYMSHGDNMINEAVFYNAVRENLTEQYPLLEHLMPRQEKDVYMTLEQVEEMFGLDLSGMGEFTLPAVREFSRWQYFALLAFMPREELEGGWRFALEREEADLWIDVQESDQETGVRVEFALRDPEAALSQAAETLTRMGIELPGAAGDFQMLRTLKAVLNMGEGQEISLPTELISQDTVELIGRIREWIQKLSFR